MPSPLKSPVPAMSQLVVGFPSPIADVTAPPVLISHSAMLPSVLRNRMSCTPSPLRSR
jgi:hypothetical protein